MEDTVIIEDFPNYSISRDGVVMNNETGHVLTALRLTSQNYKRIRFGRSKYRILHRLLAQAFIPNPDNKPFIDHINRDTLDNRLENLRWATICENNQNHSLQKNNKLKEQYISIHKVRTTRGVIDYYRYARQINYIPFEKCFKTLGEAIAFRDAHK
jgi:hypothetical protein